MAYYNRYYRSYGLRRLQHLQSPLINDAIALALPRDSAFHYLPEDSVVKGVPADHWAVKDSERLVMVEHVTELSKDATAGRPRKTAAVADREIRDYHRRYRRLKLVKDLSRDTRDSRTPLVINYALLPDLYRYTQSVYSHYYQQINLITTLWDNVERYSRQMERHHFVEFSLPSPIPPLSYFRRAEEDLNQDMLSTFSSIDHLMVLELWRWLGPNRGEGALSQLSDATLKQTNVIIRHDNKWVMFNLGRFDEWRKGAEDEGGVSPDALQKRFLRLLMTLFESTTPVVEKSDKDVVDGNAKPTDTGKEKPQVDEEEESPEEVRRQLKDETENDDDLEKELDAIRVVAEKQAADARENPFDSDVTTYEEGVMERAEDLASEGVISAAEYKRYEKIAQAHKSLKNPYTGKGTLEEAITVTEADVAIDTPTKFADSAGVVDKSMLETTLQEFDSRYVKNVLPKDVVGSVMNFQKAGVAVTDYDIERVEDVANEYEIHTIKLNPVRGKASTIRFKLPAVREDGTYIANGVKYRMRKQRGDLPIRKVKPNKVALTSYYGKVFVERSEKVAHDYGKWLTKAIREIGLDNDDARVTNLKSARSVEDTLVAPRLYSVLGQQFLSFTASEIDFYVNYAKRKDQFGEDVVKGVEKDGRVMIGRKARTPVVVDDNDTLYLVKTNGLEVIGKIEDVIGLERSKAPVDVAELKVFAKSIPLGVALAYYTGLKRLVDSLPGDVKWVGSNERFTVNDDEFSVRFEDETLIVGREDKLTAMILGGFNNYKKTIRQYGIHDFNKKDVFLNVIEEYGLGNRHLNELGLMRDMFIDPITLEILRDLKEPETWLGLLRRSAELLLTDYAPQETDLSQMRIRGYERIAGAVYLEMVNSMRGFLMREGSAGAAVDMKPFAVWKTINEDPAVALVEESNPIKNVNEKEAVTFMGVGGRSRTSMVARSRIYGENDMGTISEATVDSGDVAINTYTTANPMFTSLRGVTSRYDGKNAGPSSLLSTGALISPGADADDPKRVNFVTIQHAQGISAKGYKPTPLRTGYERVIGQRTGDLFCTTAKQPGKVVKVTDEAIQVEYKDGSVQHIELGRRFGSAAGTVFPHSVVSDLKEGQSFKEGETVAYNENFFTPDPLNPKESLWKAGVMCKTAIMEANDTFEDASVISEKVAKELGTGITKVRHLFFDFDQTVRNLVEQGTKIDPEAILCTIEDSVTADNDLFSDDTLDTLKLLSGNTPRAKYGGTVEKIEVLYYGDKEDMTDSLRAIADKADRKLAKHRKAMGKSAVTGSVDDSIRIDNQVLELDTMVIKVYITEDVGAGIGD